MTEASASGNPAVSIVVPVKDEADNIGPLVEEIAAAMARRWSFEVVYVNDGSTDTTELELTRLTAERRWLRQVKHARSCGQSAAVRTGVAAARAPIVVTLDGDGQNDPSFIPALVRSLEEASPRIGLIAGQRVGRDLLGRDAQGNQVVAVFATPPSIVAVVSPPGTKGGRAVFSTTMS